MIISHDQKRTVNFDSDYGYCSPDIIHDRGGNKKCNIKESLVL